MPPFDQLTLTTERLHLRPLRTGDEAALFAIFSDPEVMRYWSSAVWLDESNARAMIEQDSHEMATGNSLRLGLVRKVDSTLIGTVSLFGDRKSVV